MATELMVAMRTAAGLLACSCLIVILLTAGLPASPPVPPAPNSGSPCLQLQMAMEIGHYGGTKRRLLNYNDNGLRRMRRLDDTTGNSSSPSYPQGNSSSSSYPQDNSSYPSYSQGNSSSPSSSTQSSSKTSTMKYVVPIGCSVVALALVVAIVFWWVSHSHRLMTPQLGKAVSDRVVNDEETPPPNTNNKHARDNMPKSLTLKKIKHVTNNFKDELGKGAFGKVYLGNLEGNQIAVKQLTHHKRLNVSTDDFEREMGILMDVKHKNLVKFLAYCNKGDDRFLCFEFLSGGSLDMLLHASKRNENNKTYVGGNDMLLDWARRFYIIKEVCTGLHYLHVERDSQNKILHLDLKAGNILIDQGGKVVKIADFGLSRLFDAHRTHVYITNECIGTIAYLPKECLTHKPKVSEKVDIYSYGMLLLEIITGWCATDEDFPGVPTFKEMAHEALGSQDVKKVLDHALRERLEDRSVAEVLKCIELAYDCLNDDPNQRPDTKQIAQRLDS